MASSNSILSPLLVGMISGAAGAFLVIFLNSEPSSAVDSSDSSSETIALQQRIDDLELLTQEQAVSLDALRQQRPISSLQRESLDAPTREEFDQLLARLDGLSVPTQSAPESASSDRLQYAIADVLDQREQQERMEREQAAEEKRVARLQTQVDWWADRLSMTDAQASQFEDLMATRDESRREIGRLVSSGEMTKPEAAEPWQQANAAFETGLSSVLTPQQLEEMQSSGRGVK
ncbi:MAG: hypothetical protein QF489_05140 [Planctomycetota bacterium]|jgi:hypothetical protein|nr:hypothetical protein [Planctomycetota bacterium]